ncbi:MAG: CpsD/CapB family tyrosine-protein kinase, partial [Candidatus Zixiibacteriota bacterium]
MTIIDIYDIESPYVTEYRRLLYRVLNHDKQPDLKSIMFTSAMTAEGKSTACSLLAMTAAVKKRLKTLIIDADLRLPSIHHLFGLSPEPGLTEVLGEGFNPRDAVRKTSIENLHILTAGRHRENPTEVFDAEAIGQLVDEMKFYYDLILIDCAPLLP